MIILSGYFLAPITRHKGYQKYFEGGVEQAYKFCTPLIIIVNSEKQQVMKYGKVVVPVKKICSRIKKYFKKHFSIQPKIVVSHSDNRTIISDIERMKKMIGDFIVLYKDGDYDKDNPPPEANIVNVIYGKNPKIASSSEILGL